MSIDDDIRQRECVRLNKMGIRFQQINVVDEVPVTIIGKDEMDDIVQKRDSGRWFGGRFICYIDGGWEGSYVDEFRKHHHVCGLSERLVYRFVLGYKIGRTRQDSRFKGYYPKMRSKKVTS